MYRLLDPDHVAAALSMLCLLGPLAYAGGLMVVHPAKFIALLNRVSSEFYRIERLFLWRHPFPEPNPLGHSLATHTVVRLAGLVLAANGLLRMMEKASWLVSN